MRDITHRNSGSRYNVGHVRSAIRGAQKVGKYARKLYDHYSNSLKVKHVKKLSSHHKKVSPPREDLAQNDFGNVHSGSTFKLMSIKPGKGSLKSVGGALNKLMDSRSFRNTQIPGLQGVNSIYLSGTNSQWLNSVAFPALNESPVAFFEMNPYSKISGSASPFFPAGLTPKTDVFAFIRDEIVIDMTNFTNVGVSVQLFAFRCKRYTQYDPLTLWAQAESDESQGGTNMVFPGAGTTGGTLGAATYNMVHQQPHHALISEYWSIVGSTICVMGGGASQRVKIMDRPNQVCHRDKLVVNTLKFVPGSLCIISIAVGDVVQDVTTGVIPTFGPTNVGVCITTKKHFKAVMGNAARVKTQLAESFVPTGATTANTREVNITDGSAVVSL